MGFAPLNSSYDALTGELSLSLSHLRMRPCHLGRGLELRGLELRQRRGGPALLAPGVRHRHKGRWREHALELLLVWRELEVCAAAVGRERHVDAGDLERGTVEVRR